MSTLPAFPLHHNRYLDHLSDDLSPDHTLPNDLTLT